MKTPIFEYYDKKNNDKYICSSLTNTKEILERISLDYGIPIDDIKIYVGTKDNSEDDDTITTKVY